MAKPVFDKNLFKAAQQKASEKKFSEVEKGIYNCTIHKACIEHSKKGRLQAKFDFKISEDDAHFANSHFWNYIGLTNNDGEQQEKGYEILGIILSVLKVDPNIDDPDQAVESTIGSKVRVDYDPGDDENYGKCRITKLLERPDGSSVSANYGSSRTDELDEVEAAETPDTQVSIEQGDILTLTTGKKIVLVAMLDSNETEDGKQYVMGYPVGGSMAQADKYSAELICGVEKALPKGATDESPKPAPAASTPAPTASKPSASELDELDGGGLEEEEEEEEEESDTPLKVGDMVKGTSAVSGQSHTGPITAIADGVIKVSADGKIRKLIPDTVVRV